VTRNATGQIRRLTAAVVLNRRRGEPDKDGKAQSTPLSEQELDSVNALVREAIGLNKERGDSVNVMNAPFTVEEVPKPVDLPLWRQPENIAMAKDAGKHLGLLLLGLLTIFGVIRPALKTLPGPPPPPAPRLSEKVENELVLPPPTQPQDDVLKSARDDPTTVANVVRTWVRSSNG
jgi:flagellar M-ring protein FliF